MRTDSPERTACGCPAVLAVEGTQRPCQSAGCVAAGQMQPNTCTCNKSTGCGCADPAPGLQIECRCALDDCLCAGCGCEKADGQVAVKKCCS